MMPGPTQIIIIVFVILLLFGAKKLPALARGLGESISEFKQGRRDGEIEAATRKAEDKTAEESKEAEPVTKA